MLSLSGGPSSVLGQGTRSHKPVTLPRGGKERMYKEVSEINFNIFNFNPNIIISNVINGIFVCIIFKILCVFSFLNFILINSFFFNFILMN